MKIVFSSQTYLGKWSTRLFIVFLIFLGLLALFAIFGQTFHDNPWLTIPVFIVYGTTISSFIVGLVSIVARREQSFWVYLAVGVSLFFIIFEIIDILFH